MAEMVCPLGSYCLTDLAQRFPDRVLGPLPLPQGHSAILETFLDVAAGMVPLRGSVSERLLSLKRQQY